MLVEGGTDRLGRLVRHQLGNLYLPTDADLAAVDAALPAALERTEVCFAPQTNKYYHRDGEVFFDPSHTGQACVFLYFLSHQLHRGGATPAAALVYGLNKALHGLDLFYEVELPRVWFTDHPVGAVLGRASYGEGFSFIQHCTVGQNGGRYPVIGQDVTMLAGSSVLGGSSIGDGAVIAAGTIVVDQDVPAEHLAFGRSPDLVLKPRR